jgi:hypothetical protein
VVKSTLDIFESGSIAAGKNSAITPLKTGVSMLAVCVLMVSAPAFAQETPADPAKPEATTEDNALLARRGLSAILIRLLMRLPPKILVPCPIVPLQKRCNAFLVCRLTALPVQMILITSP